MGTIRTRVTTTNRPTLAIVGRWTTAPTPLSIFAACFFQKYFFFYIRFLPDIKSAVVSRCLLTLQVFVYKYFPPEKKKKLKHIQKIQNIHLPLSTHFLQSPTLVLLDNVARFFRRL